MNIFAGAPRVEEGQDPWVVIPRLQHGNNIPNIASINGPTTIGRSTLRHANSRLSRTVDAVIDSPAQGEHGEEQDVVGTLLERTLTRRGMSDSSIHSTFKSHGEEQGSPRRPVQHQEPEPTGGYDRNSVLQALSRRMQSFRFAAPETSASIDTGPSISRPDTPVSGGNAADGRQTPLGTRASSPRAVSPTSARLFSNVNLSSWAAAALDPSQEPTTYLAGSPREEAYMHRAWDREM